MMHTRRSSFLLVAVGVALAACAPKVQDTALDEASLRANTRIWFTAYNAGDADTVANLYADDAWMMAPGTTPVSGRVAIRKAIAADIEKSRAAGLSLKFTETTGVGVTGDMGWLSGSVSVLEAGLVPVDSGNFLNIYRREDGAWKLIRDIWNSERPPSAPAAAPAPAN